MEFRSYFNADGVLREPIRERYMPSVAVEAYRRSSSSGQVRE